MEAHQYDDFTEAYAAYTDQREAGGIEGDPILLDLLALLGDIEGRQVLDAGCGDGYLSRVLAARGAHVTGMDMGPRLIAMARRRDPNGTIEYRVADLSEPMPESVNRFDVIASNLVLNDVENYRGLAATLASLLKPGGRMVHTLNNPYGAVIRKHVADYFDSGALSPYRGLWTAGIKTYHHHRTLEEYLDAFLDAGLTLTKLADHSHHVSTHETADILPEGAVFPRFMLLAFEKPAD
jgi:2-polyprenyl-3-methyl-5-hydroxy-6-metoxy-1,4-benzoquinol methylase